MNVLKVMANREQYKAYIEYNADKLKPEVVDQFDVDYSSKDPELCRILLSVSVH
jgi:hypothetical protein